MKTKHILLTSLLFASAATGATTFNLGDLVDSNDVTPDGTAPWAVVEFTTLNSNQVKFDLGLNLAATEFMTEFRFNFDPALDLSKLTVLTWNTQRSITGNFVMPSITVGNVKGKGNERFDVGLSFSKSNAGNGKARFNHNDALSWTMTYDGEGFDENSFSFASSDGYFTQGKVQGIGENDYSSWITDSSRMVPEPDAAVMLGLFGTMFLIRRKR